MPENRVKVENADLNVQFTNISARRNLTSGENIAVSLGKVQKYFDDLGDAAFKDVDNIPLEGSTNPISSQAAFSMNDRIIGLENKLDTKIYGFHINPNESDPYEAVTYIADAVGMTPAKMGSSVFDYGSWEKVFFMPKPCMVKYDGTVDYYLDPNDFSKKLDGTASDIADPGYGGNAMMEWPKIWFKYVPGVADGEWSFYASNSKIDSSYKCWCNINANNQEIDHFYTAIYNGVKFSNYSSSATYVVGDTAIYDGKLYRCKTAISTAEEFDSSKWDIVTETAPDTSKLRSISGIMLTTKNGSDNTTAQQEIDAALANNTTANVEWYTEVWSDRLLINDLLYLMGKSLDLQGTFGQGISSGSQDAKQSYVTGTLNNRGLFYGNITGTSTAVKVFGMENLWALVWRRIAGCVNKQGTLLVKMTYNTADGSTATSYNLDGTGYLNFGSVYTQNGYVTKMKADQEKGYIPSQAGTTGSGSSTYYCDYYYQATSSTYYLLLGGRSGDGARCGFDVYLTVGASAANWTVSAALSLKNWGG